MKQWRRLAWCLALGCALSITACGDDDGDDDGEAGEGSSGTGGRDGGAGNGGSGGSNAGNGGSGGSNAGSGGSSGGTGGAGGMTGGSSADDDASVGDDDGGEADAITASAAIEGLEANIIHGTVTFIAEEADVSAFIELNDCADGSYQVHIHEGADCANYGPHWDTPRGVGIPNVTCSGDHGELTYVRAGTDAKAWSVDLGDEETDVNGHTFVVHDSGGTVIACGEINVDE